MEFRKKLYVIILGMITCLVVYSFIGRESTNEKTKIMARQSFKYRPLPQEEYLNTGNSNISSINEQLLQDIEAERQRVVRDDGTSNKTREGLEEEERIRLEDEREAMGVAVKLGLVQIKEETQDSQKRKRDEKLKYMDGLRPADPRQYNGLDSAAIHKKYPGIAFLPEYRVREFLDPADTQSLIMKKHPKTMEDVDDFLAEERFYELVGELHIECLEVQHMGNKEDGGWDVCLSQPYKPSDDCLIYSFGIANDFTFDDAMMYGYGCHVRAFDPSMTIGDHKHNQKVWFYQLGLGEKNTVNSNGWKLETLGSILAKSGHSDRIIDVLKIDIEYNEWSCFQTIFKEKVLSKVKQLVFEIHTPEVFMVNRESTREDFFYMYNTLLELEKLGFRRFQVHYNHFGQYISYKSGQHRTCCYEFSYVNINYLTL